MGLYIEDGSGSGRQAGVDIGGRLLTASVSSSLEHFTNHHGHAYNVLFEQTQDGTDDCIFYLKNTSESDLVLEGMGLAVTAACVVRVEINNTGTPISPTDITPVNLNAGSGKQASGVFQTGGSLDLGAGSVIERYFFLGGESDSIIFNFEQDVIVPKNRVMTVWSLLLDSSADVPTVYGTVIFNYHIMGQ